MKDKVYIESEDKNAKTAILLPNYGEVKLIVQQGRVIRFETKEINLVGE
jgi:hypothetical protein